MRRLAALAGPATGRPRCMRGPCAKHGRQALRHASRPVPLAPCRRARPPYRPGRHGPARPGGYSRVRPCRPRGASRRRRRAASRAEPRTAGGAGAMPRRSRRRPFRPCPPRLRGGAGEKRRRGGAGEKRRRGGAGEKRRRGGAGRAAAGAAPGARAARRYLPNLSPSQSGHFSPCVGRPHVRQWRSTLTASYGCVVKSLRTSTTAIMMPIAIPIHTSTMAPRRAGP